MSTLGPPIGAVWAGLVPVVDRLFPDAPIVGYERDEDLRAALAVGFRDLGPLQVWVRDP